MLRDLARKLLYGSGALGLYHRLRNGDQLTVVSFHRILDRADPRWQTCDPSYTLDVELLAKSLAFFKRHYNVVSLEQVAAARRGEANLPSHPMLITFDDGWRDNADFALPALQRAGLPAVLFVVADVVNDGRAFYQEEIVSAWRRGTLTVAALARALAAIEPDVPTPANEQLSSLRPLITRISALSPERRDALLAPLRSALDDGVRQMVDLDDLVRLQQGGVTLGLHGKTHTPMTRAADVDIELDGARSALRGMFGDTPPDAISLSFPHGSYTPEIARRARDAGYELAFTSDPVLNPIPGGLGAVLGRTGYETETVMDERGDFRPDRLALYLFRCKSRRLD
jgi:peptidoglycan/xylan/chitin deacetylase (PgdA/CDA1 family)